MRELFLERLELEMNSRRQARPPRYHQPQLDSPFKLAGTPSQDAGGPWSRLQIPIQGCHSLPCCNDVIRYVGRWYPCLVLERKSTFVNLACGPNLADSRPTNLFKNREHQDQRAHKLLTYGPVFLRLRGYLPPPSNINIPRPQRITLNKRPSRLNVIPHQRRKDPIRRNRIFNLHPQ